MQQESPIQSSALNVISCKMLNIIWITVSQLWSWYQSRQLLLIEGLTTFLIEAGNNKACSHLIEAPRAPHALIVADKGRVIDDGS